MAHVPTTDAAPLSDDDIGLLTIAEAAAAMEVRQGTVRTWILRYTLPTTRLADGRVAVSERALMDCELSRRIWHEARSTHAAAPLPEVSGSAAVSAIRR